MRHRRTGYLAAGWAVVFALPHLWWATGRKDGLATALSARIVDGAGTPMAIACAAIAGFCLCGAAVALATVAERPERVRPPVRRVLVALTWFGAALLVVRSLDIYVEFCLALTGVRQVPPEELANFLHLSRWFMFGYGPWFAVGAVVWARLAWLSSRPVAVGHRV